MKSIDLKSLIIGILGTALVFVLMGQSSVQREPYQVQCVPMEDTIGMGYVACRIFDMQSWPAPIKCSRLNVSSSSVISIYITEI